MSTSTRTAASVLLAAAAASVGIVLAAPATADPNASQQQPALPAVQNHESLPPGLINLLPPGPCRTACGVGPVTDAFNRFNERFNTGNTVGGPT